MSLLSIMKDILSILINYLCDSNSSCEMWCCLSEILLLVSIAPIIIIIFLCTLPVYCPIYEIKFIISIDYPSDNHSSIILSSFQHFFFQILLLTIYLYFFTSTFITNFIRNSFQHFHSLQFHIYKFIISKSCFVSHFSSLEPWI